MSSSGIIIAITRRPATIGHARLRRAAVAIQPESRGGREEDVAGDDKSLNQAQTTPGLKVHCEGRYTRAACGCRQVFCERLSVKCLNCKAQVNFTH